MYLNNGPGETNIVSCCVGDLTVTHKETPDSDWNRDKAIVNQFLTKWDKDKKEYVTEVIEQNWNII